MLGVDTALLEVNARVKEVDTELTVVLEEILCLGETVGLTKEMTSARRLEDVPTLAGVGKPITINMVPEDGITRAEDDTVLTALGVGRLLIIGTELLGVYSPETTCLRTKWGDRLSGPSAR